MIRYPLLVAGLVWLSACTASLPQIQHLQLSAGATDPPTSDSPTIMLDAISLPDFLLRDELLRRDSDYALRYDSTRRWAEPLDLGIQRVLARRLAQDVGTRQIARYPDVSPMGATWTLRISVTHFEADSKNAVLRAEGRWERSAERGNTAAVVDFDGSLPLASSDAQDIAAAMSALLWQFSDALSEPLVNPPDAASSPIEININSN